MNLPGDSTRRRRQRQRRLPSIDDAVYDEIQPCDVSIHSTDPSTDHNDESALTISMTTGESTHEGWKKRKRLSNCSEVSQIPVVIDHPSDDDVPKPPRRKRSESNHRHRQGVMLLDSGVEEDSDHEVVILGTSFPSEISARPSLRIVERPRLRSRRKMSDFRKSLLESIAPSTPVHETKKRFVRSTMKEQDRKQSSFAEKDSTTTPYLRKTRNCNKGRDPKIDRNRMLRVSERHISRSRNGDFKDSRFTPSSPPKSSLGCGYATRSELRSTCTEAEALDGSAVRNFRKIKKSLSIDKGNVSKKVASLDILEDHDAPSIFFEESDDDDDSEWSDNEISSSRRKLARKNKVSRHEGRPCNKRAQERRDEVSHDGDPSTRRHAMGKQQNHCRRRVTYHPEQKAMTREKMSSAGKFGRSPSKAEIAPAELETKPKFGRIVGESEAYGLRDASEIAYQIALAKLRKQDLRSAVNFCQLYLMECYAKADELSCDIVSLETDKGKKQELVTVRETVAGVWCAFARLLLTLANENFNGNDEDSFCQDSFGHLDECNLEQIHVSLLDFSLMLLSKAASCSLVGNHAWIALSYSRIAQFASAQSSHGRVNQIQNKHSSLEAASKLCHQVLGTLADVEPYFDRAVIDLLARLELFDISPTMLLWQRIGNSLGGDIVFRDDEASASLVIREINQLVFRQSRCDDNALHEAPQWVRTDRALSRLLVSVGGTCISRSRILTESSSARIDSSGDASQREGVDLTVSNTVKYFDVECLTSDPDGKRPQVIPLGRRRTNKKTSAPMLDRAKRRHGCRDVVFYCPTCIPSEPFVCEESLRVHCQGCTRRSVQTDEVHRPVEITAMPFGAAELVGDWSKRSFDPQHGPLLSHDDLLDVLGYSIEIFETNEEDVFNFSSDDNFYTLFAPYHVGQVGLRCQHCHNVLGGSCSAPGSFAFPKTVEELPQVAWFLSLTHLDHCVNQPRCVHAWHQEYRRKICFTSFLPAEYWANVAKDFNLKSEIGGGVVVAKEGTAND